jgi:hypothetical protein
VGQRVIEQRERVGQHHRRTEALNRARRVEHARGRRQCAAHRGQREDGHAPLECPPRAEAVAERAGRQHERGERDGVGVDDPLQPVDASAQRVRHRRQRDVDDRDVELADDESHARGEHDEGERRRAGGGDVLGHAPILAARRRGRFVVGRSVAVSTLVHVNGC